MERFQSKVRNYRSKKNITQEQLADEIGCSRKTISDIESRNGCNPRLGTAKLLAKFFCCTVDELFEEVEE